ncbi:hypothetical protein VKT23_007908 [Stygiomarasmius scandens]|uniref:Kinesin-like protein n=1 Tax=Marasmiellus scandens TaxID=2682957 RepID=A0ABR1JM13_9AGAR
MSQKIRIAARLRPRLEGEIEDGGIKVCHAVDQSDSSTSSAANSSVSGGSYISVQNPRVPGQVFNFPFSSCYDQHSTQEEIFLNDVQPMTDIVYNGVTVTIFAYGVTSSGKTHTMQGTKAEPGVIPRAVRALFARKAEYSQYQVTLSVSYMEIYKDEAYDLLVNRENAPKLPVRENDVGLVFVANLSSMPIDNAEQFDRIYAQATKNRSVGATNLNRASSRSHAVLTVEVTMVDVAHHMTRTGKMNLVDLAGSENNKHTGNDATRMAESAAINKSLTALGQVVHALNKGHSRIPYRDSKLTRILQDALGGSSVGLLICNIAPGTKFRQDTLNTLNFASRTKNIENKPVINERDNRPVPKPHFAALNVPQQPASTKPYQHSVQPTAPNVENFMPTGVDIYQPQPVPNARKERRSGRPSMVPVPQPRSSRTSSANFPTGSFNFQSSYQPFGGTMASGSGSASSSAGPSSSGGAGTMASASGLSEKEIDERISKAVEMEVARRLEEREKERLRELEEERRLAAEQQAKQAAPSGSASRSGSTKTSPARHPAASVSRSGSTSAHGTPTRSGSKRRGPSKSPRRDTITRERDAIQPAQAIPPGILTPLLKKHRDLDEQLSTRLQELERKYEQSNKETQLASVLSPVSKKKTGRAYVALARAHSEKGDLEVALDLYRKAESYVPDNIKLKERILEIEWAVKNNKPFVPSPKMPKKEKKGKSKSKSKSKSKAELAPIEENGNSIAMDVDVDGQTGEDLKDEEPPTDIDLGEDMDGFERAFSEHPMSDALMDVEEVAAELHKPDDEFASVEPPSGVLAGQPLKFGSFGAFGTEITNGNVGFGADDDADSSAKETGKGKGNGKGKGKRAREEDVLVEENEENEDGSPAKRLRRSPRKRAQVKSYYPSDEEDLSSAPVKRGRKRLA